MNDTSINCFDGEYSKEQLKEFSEDNLLKCPICGKNYEYCHGRVNNPYFRHKDKVDCNIKYQESETPEHIKGKIDLYNWIKTIKGVTDVQLEQYIPETDQCTDVGFKYGGKQYVIEYQCSPIATEYFERHELYESVGIKDIWICGTDKYFQKEMRGKTIEKHCAAHYDVGRELFVYENKEWEYGRFEHDCKKYGFDCKNYNELVESNTNKYKTAMCAKLSDGRFYPDNEDALLQPKYLKEQSDIHRKNNIAFKNTIEDLKHKLLDTGLFKKVSFDRKYLISPHIKKNFYYNDNFSSIYVTCEYKDKFLINKLNISHNFHYWEHLPIDNIYFTASEDDINKFINNAMVHKNLALEVFETIKKGIHKAIKINQSIFFDFTVSEYKYSYKEVKCRNDHSWNYAFYHEDVLTFINGFLHALRNVDYMDYGVDFKRYNFQLPSIVGSYHFHRRRDTHNFFTQLGFTNFTIDGRRLNERK